MADNLNDINFDDLNQEAAELKASITSISSYLGNILRTNRQIAQSYGIANSELLNTRNLASELSGITKKDLKDKQKLSALQTKAMNAQKEGRKLQAEIGALTVKLANAQGAEYQVILDILAAKQEELLTNQAITSQANEILNLSKKQKSAQEEYNEGIKDFAKNLDGVKKIQELLTFAGLVKAINEADKSTTEVAKQLGISKAEARGIRADFNEIALTTSNSALNAESLTKSFLELGNNLGAVSGFTQDNIIAQTELTKQVGLQSEEASNLVGLGILNGKTNQEVTGEILDQVVALDKQTGIRLDGRKILAEVAKVEGQLAAQYGFNNKLIAQAVVLTKKYGLELKQAEQISNSLLDFESSIESELSAELLTGKQLNLERARSLSLAGKTAEAAEEVAQQFGSVEEFTSMNVIQQRELAKAVGLSTDELANSIKQREILNRLGANRIEDLKNTTDEEGKVLYQQMLQQSAAEKFEQAVVKIQAAIGSLLEGPLGGLLDLMVMIADNAALTVLAMGAIGAISFVRVLASLVPLITGLATGAASAATLSSALTFGLGAIAIVAGVTAIMAAFGAFSDDAESSAQQAVADGIAPPGNGPFTITDSYGRTAITANGDGVAVSPNINQGEEPIQPIITPRTPPSTNNVSSPPNTNQGGGSAQPIVIKNTFSNFQSAGPYALAETQRRQASPTFA
jgi:hypothetical protein